MTTAFWISYVLLWCLVVVLVLLVVLVYRQFGLVFMRSIDRIVMQGLDVRSRAPDIAIADRSGRAQTIAFGAADSGGRSAFVLFALPGCTICAGLAGTLVSLPAERPDVRFVWVDGSSPPPPPRAVEGSGWNVGSASDDRIHREWDVSAVPFGFVVAPNGRIADKRLINSREDLEAALTAVTAGYVAPTEAPMSKELVS